MVSRIELAFIVAVHLLDNRTGDRAARTDAASRPILPKAFRSRAPGPARGVTRRADTVHKARRRARSAERRVGKACVSTSRSRWSPDHSKKQGKLNPHEQLTGNKELNS